MNTLERLTSALFHLTTYVKPGSDDKPSVDYIAQQLERAIAELTARQDADRRRIARRLANADEDERCITCGALLDDDEGSTCNDCHKFAHMRQEQPCT